MADSLDSSIVLRLNSLHQRIGWSTVRQAFSGLMGGVNGDVPFMALDLQYNLDSDGKPIYKDGLINLARVSWEDWLKLPIRPWDGVIHGVRQQIRIPTVIVCSNFNDMPKKELAATAKAIRKRDGNRCQYTNVELTNSTFSLDHIVPRSKGGKDSWTNLVACHKKVNSDKGNKYNHEVGLKLLKQPVAPRKIPLCALYQEIKHPDHQWF